MVALLLETVPQHKAREINKKNEHYWTTCIQIPKFSG